MSASASAPSHAARVRPSSACPPPRSPPRPATEVHAAGDAEELGFDEMDASLRGEP